jgi:hypothetical protein
VVKLFSNARKRIVAALIVAMTGTVLTAFGASPAQAQPAGCAGPNGYGAWVTTNATFKQRVGINLCASPEQIGARIGFSPLSNYLASHVVGCRVYIVMSADTFHESHTQTMDCTGAAKLGRPWEMNTPAAFLRYATGVYHFTGWVNLQTSVHYDTYPYASRISFCGQEGC